MCDCGNSLALDCLCRMNVISDSRGVFINGNTFVGQVQFNDRRLFRQNYQVGNGPPAFQHRWTWPKWGVELEGAGLEDESVHDLIADGDFLYVIGQVSGSSTVRVLKIDLKLREIVWSVNTPTTHILNPNGGSLSPAGLDLLAPISGFIRPVKTRLNNAGVMVLQSTQLPAPPAGTFFVGQPYIGTITPSGGLRGYRESFTQPRYNRENTCAMGNVASVSWQNTPSNPTDRLQFALNVGPLAANGTPGTLTNVWRRTLVHDTAKTSGGVNPPGFGVCHGQCGGFGGEIFYSGVFWSQMAPGTIGGETIGSCMKSHTPWGTFEYDKPTGTTAVGVFHEVYPDGLAIAFPTGNYPVEFDPDGLFHTGAVGYIDPSYSWVYNLQVPHIAHGAVAPVNSDENGIWFQAAGIDWNWVFPHIFPANSFAQYARIHKNGLKGELIVGSPWNGFSSEVFKRADCIAAGPPDQYPLS